jgi:hypothetical protein
LPRNGKIARGCGFHLLESITCRKFRNTLSVSLPLPRSIRSFKTRAPARPKHARLPPLPRLQLRRQDTPFTATRQARRRRCGVRSDAALFRLRWAGVARGTADRTGGSKSRPRIGRVKENRIR